jgi:hypothetical protein
MAEAQPLGTVLRTIVLIVLVVVAGCHHARRPDFMTRVREDCGAGRQWACDLIDALSQPPATDDDEKSR